MKYSNVEKIIYNKYPLFSVIISVYKKDRPEWFDIALASIIDQNVKPSEIVLVVDGPIPYATQKVIDKYVEVCKEENIFFNLINTSLQLL